MSDNTERDALERWVSAQLPSCSHDELRIVARIIERVAVGRDVYGPFSIASNTRDLRAEAADEMSDLLWYLCAAEVARTEKRLEIERNRETER